MIHFLNYTFSYCFYAVPRLIKEKAIKDLYMQEAFDQIDNIKIWFPKIEFGRNNFWSSKGSSVWSALEVTFKLFWLDKNDVVSSLSSSDFENGRNILKPLYWFNPVWIGNNSE